MSTENKMPNPVEVDFAEIEGKLIADLLANCPVLPVFFQTEKVAEKADVPVQEPRPPVKDPLVIRIQRRHAKDGTELFRVHRQCDRFWHWVPTYAQASAIATNLFHYGCIYEDYNAADAS